MVKILISLLLFVMGSLVMNGFETNSLLNKKFFDSYTDKIFEVSTYTPLDNDAAYSSNDSIGSVANFIDGVSIFLPDTLKISSTLGRMTKVDAAALKFWCDNNYEYLRWGLIDDAMNLALFENINSKFYTAEESRLKARFNLRRLKYVPKEITDYEMEEYLVSRMIEIGELFKSSPTGYVESVWLNLYNCAFLYAIAKYSDNLFFNENTGVITRREFQDLCDWCYLNSSVLNLSEIHKSESIYINRQMMEF